MVMDHSSLDELRKQFGAVAATIAEGLSAENPHVVALVAKWDSADLVPGLSDMDFRVVCDDRTTVEDWVEIDRIAGRLHLEMVRANPQWNRINEHTAGLALTMSEALDGDGGNPEHALWSLWWGSEEWFHRLKAQAAARDFNATDERYHLSKFLAYYSPYIHGIDPPINLGRFEPKYPLHSRCWHYFAPPILSAAAILARKNFAGKRAGLTLAARQRVRRRAGGSRLPAAQRPLRNARADRRHSAAGVRGAAFRGVQGVVPLAGRVCRISRPRPVAPAGGASPDNWRRWPAIPWRR